MEGTASISVVWDVESDPDLSWLETVQDEEGNIIRSYRYSNADFERYGRDTVQGWIDEDRQELEEYGKTWWMLYAKAVAHIRWSNGLSSKIETGGIGGVESDSTEDTFREIEQDLLDDLYRMLDGMGVTYTRGMYDVVGR